MSSSMSNSKLFKTPPLEPAALNKAPWNGSFSTSYGMKPLPTFKQSINVVCIEAVVL